MSEQCNEFIDLDLSVKWANKNIGTGISEEIGDYLNYIEAEELVNLSEKEVN